MRRQAGSLRPFGRAALLGLCMLSASCGLGSIGSSAANTDATPTPTPTPKRYVLGKPSGVPAERGVIVQAGDSIGHGDGAAGNWAAIEHLGLPSGIQIHNVSTNGKWMLTGLGQREVEIFPFYDKQNASVLVIQQGTNDLAGGKAADYQYYNILRPFVQLSQAAGFFVVVDTILPRADPGWTGNPDLEKQRVAYNNLVRANSIGADAINDLASDPEIGDAINPATSLMYYDALHLRKEGQERVAKIEAKLLAKMLEYPRRLPSAPGQ